MLIFFVYRNVDRIFSSDVDGIQMLQSMIRKDLIAAHFRKISVYGIEKFLFLIHRLIRRVRLGFQALHPFPDTGLIVDFIDT